MLKEPIGYCIIVGSDAPSTSSKPSPLEPGQIKVELCRTNAHVSAYDFSHLAAMLVATCFKKCSASLGKAHQRMLQKEKLENYAIIT